MNLGRFAIGACLFAFAMGLAMRYVGAPYWGRVATVSAAPAIFLWPVPAMGARAREPHDAPGRRVHWGD